MKKIKYITVICLLGFVGIGAYSLYIHNAMTTEEKLILENIEALAGEEGGSILLAKYRTEHVFINGPGSFLPGNYDCCMPSFDTDYCNYGLLKCRDRKFD